MVTRAVISAGSPTIYRSILASLVAFTMLSLEPGKFDSKYKDRGTPLVEMSVSVLPNTVTIPLASIEERVWTMEQLTRKIKSVNFLADYQKISEKRLCQILTCYPAFFLCLLICLRYLLNLLHFCFSCICQDGWFSPGCALRYNPCESSHHNCSEGSTCVPLSMGYECDCPLGKSGKFCEKGR